MIRRKRILNRIEQSHQKLKERLQRNVPLIVHWGWKLLPELTSKEKIDRLPIIISLKGNSQMLSVAKLSSVPGEAQAQAIIYKALNEWDVAEKVIGMSFDTASANTGKDNGTCAHLEEKLGKKLFYFAFIIILWNL